MDRTTFCEALYALPDNIVVKHRRSIAVPSLAAFAGAALIISDKFVNGANNDNLRSSLVFFGAAIIVISAAILLIRLFSDVGDPYHTSMHCRLKGKELFFGRAQMEKVLACIDRGDMDALLDMEQSSVPSIAVLVYRSPCGNFTACRPYEYAALEYRPLRGIKIVERLAGDIVKTMELDVPSASQRTDRPESARQAAPTEQTGQVERGMPDGEAGEE